MRRICLIRCNEFRPQSVDVLSAILAKEIVFVRTGSGGIVQLGNYLAVVVDCTPCQKGRAGSVCVVIGCPIDIDAQCEMLGLEFDPPNVIGRTLNKPPWR